MIRFPRSRHSGWWLLLAAVLLTAAVYAPGLAGTWLFDDYPNIVNNEGVQPEEASVSSLARAALSSPSSTFKRPLASLSFALNYLAVGLDPYAWKVTNLVIHLLNGLLVFLLARMLLIAGSDATRLVPTRQSASPFKGEDGRGMGDASIANSTNPSPPNPPLEGEGLRAGIVAALIAGGWMLLPINLTAVLYVVQRMESMANFFVLLGLIGYMAGRARMLDGRSRGLLLVVVSLIVPTFLGLLAKETAVMLPLYALLIEWIVFRFQVAEDASGWIPGSGGAGPGMTGEKRGPGMTGEKRGPGMTVEGRDVGVTAGKGEATASPVISDAAQRRSEIHRRRRGRRWMPGSAAIDGRLVVLFLVVLVLPMLAGLAWMLPHVLEPATWARRDFTLATRLLSEARIVVDYIGWTLLPVPESLSFYHDQFHASTSLLTPWTTALGMLVIAALLALMVYLRRRMPLVSLGLALYFGCHVLTGTILNLELIYEHRNYFASFGLLLAVVPLLAAPLSALPMVLARRTLLATLLLWWTAMTAFTAYAWGNPLRLAEELAVRAPQSPRALYELGRTYIIYSDYDPDSPFTELAYAPLERAADLPDASILPEQALIFMNAHMHRPIKDAWWVSLVAKLKTNKPGVQDESSLAALTKCATQGGCDLAHANMVAAFLAALSHPNPSARLLATYGDYAWNELDDFALGLRMTENAVETSPDEPAYHITLTRMYIALGRADATMRQLAELQRLNIGGRLDADIAKLRTRMAESQM